MGTHANFSIKFKFDPLRVDEPFYYWHLSCSGDPITVRDTWFFLELLEIEDEKSLRKFLEKTVVKEFPDDDLDWDDWVLRIQHPAIYYGAQTGILSEYSYIIDRENDVVMIYESNESIFYGTIKEAKQFIKDFKKE